MPTCESFPPTERQAREWLREAGNGKRRIKFSDHVELRMQQRKIGRRQVLRVLKTGAISEHLHQDARGDWRCSVSAQDAGVRLKVGVVLKQGEDGVWVVVATVFEEG